MSCNYADGLSPYSEKGKLGLPEIPDNPEDVLEKVNSLAKWIREAKHVVFHTGAGISTSAGIPDFRGPNGVWTLEKKGTKPEINISFDSALPTFTHMTLKAFTETGVAKFIISQNIDGLHLKSGVKRTNMSELHGNMFVAKCSYCNKFLVQGSSLPTVGQKEVGRDCPVPKAGGRACRGKLHDTLLDWEHDLPGRELDTADMHSTLSDLSICLGTTLQIVPAGNLPLRAKKNPDGGKLVIVNLQATKHDKNADMVIRAKLDFVMEELAKNLKVVVTPYSSEIDPTYKLRQGGNHMKIIDWTIPANSITRLKKLVVELKAKVAISKKKYKSKRIKYEEPCDNNTLSEEAVVHDSVFIKHKTLDSKLEKGLSVTEICKVDIIEPKVELDNNIQHVTTETQAQLLN